MLKQLSRVLFILGGIVVISYSPVEVKADRYQFRAPVCDDCPVCSPTPTPTPEECSLYSLRMFFQHRDRGGRAFELSRMFFTGNPEDHRYDTNHTDDANADMVEFLPCMQQAIQSAASDPGMSSTGHALLRGLNRNSYYKDADQRIFDAIIAKIGGYCTAEQIAAGESNKSCFSHPDWVANGAYAPLYQSLWSQEIFIDSSCNMTEAPADRSSVCGETVSVGLIGSPISLLMSDNVNIDKEATIVNFQIDPNLPGVYSWKASSNAPLLAVDYNGSGKITSATQLFGDWTFGGKRYSSLATSEKSDLSLESQKWENGYEALSSLDTNSDGEVSGKELDGIVLWFDNNRDGISDKGEVKKLSEVGITKLFYNTDTKDELTGSIYANKGYERIVDGKAVIGRSVDWYGEHANSVSELVDRAQLRGTVTSELSGDSSNDDSSDFGSSLPKSFDALRGAWLWSVNEPGASGIQKGAAGNLVFAKSPHTGKLVGISLVEQALYKKDGSNDDKYKSMVKYWNLYDFKSLGEDRLSFKYQNEDKSFVLTEVRIQGDKLIGQSKVDSGSVTSIIYSWTAERIK